MGRKPGWQVIFQGQFAKQIRRHSVDDRRWLVIVTAGLLLGLCVPVTASPADAATASRISVTAVVPASGTEVWVDVDAQSGSSNQLTGEFRNNAGWIPLTLQETVFGLGAVASVQPGTVEFRMTSSVGSNPDLALTVVDAKGAILIESRARLALTPPTPPAPVGTVETPAASVPEGPVTAPAAPVLEGTVPTPGAPAAEPAGNPTQRPAAEPAPDPGTAPKPAAQYVSSTKSDFLANSGVSGPGMLGVSGALLGAGVVTIMVTRRRRGNR